MTVARLALPLALALPGPALAAPAAGRPVRAFLEVVPSPDGAFVASVEGDVPPSGHHPPVRELVIRRVAGGAATTVALPCGRAPECWPAAPAWSPDGKVAFALRTPASHARAIYTVAPDGSALTKLLDFGGTLESLRFGPGGRLALLATANARKEIGATEAGAALAGDMDEAPAEQRIALLEKGALRFVSPADLFVYEYDWLPDGSGFAGTAAPGDGDAHWWTAKLYRFPAAGGDPRVLYAPKTPRQQLATPKVSGDGRTVAFIAGIMSDFGSTGGDVYTVPTAGGRATCLTEKLHASATAIGWSCEGALDAQILAGGESQVVELGAKPGGRPRLLWKGAETLHGTELSPVCPSGVAAVAHESFTSPPEIEVGGVGRWRELSTANAGLAMPLHARSLAWKRDGFDVQGWLLLPEHPGDSLPLVTVVHGGPAGAHVPQFAGPGLWRKLLERGYALLLPNPRGSFGQGERFTAANVRDFGHGDLRDILAGVDAAERAAPIDEARLAILGHSYGGYLTMFAVTQTNRFKAAVASAGISDWLSYYGENGIDAWLLPYFGASVYADPAVYARSSPLGFIRRVRTPTLEWVGARDVECPAPQTQEFWHALKELGVPTSFVVFPDEGHHLRDPAHLAEAERRTLDWLDRYLGSARTSQSSASAE